MYTGVEKEKKSLKIGKAPCPTRPFNKSKRKASTEKQKQKAKQNRTNNVDTIAVPASTRSAVTMTLEKE